MPKAQHLFKLRGRLFFKIFFEHTICSTGLERGCKPVLFNWKRSKTNFRDFLFLRPSKSCARGGCPSRPTLATALVPLPRYSPAFLICFVFRTSNPVNCLSKIVKNEFLKTGNLLSNVSQLFQMISIKPEKNW